MDPRVLHRLSVFLQNCVNVSTRRALKVLSASKQSLVLCHGSHSGFWVFVNALNCEHSIDVLAELRVQKEALWVIRLVLVSESFELVVCKVEFHGGENGFELRTCDSAFAQLVVVCKELLNPDPVHHHLGPHSVFCVRRVIANFDLLLRKAVV